MASYAVGILYDALTPQVKAQLIKDLIAIKDMPKARDLMVYYDGDNEEVAAVLASLQIERCPFASVAPVWVLYRTQEGVLDAPEHATEVFEHDMRVFVKDIDLDAGEHSPFYLAPQGRNITPTLDLNRPMPAWYPGGPPPSLVWLWG